VLDAYESCELCPRRCGIDRTKRAGACGVSADLVIARAALHYWEEPCLSGDRGSGAIFFSGCGLGCVYCQNWVIAKNRVGRRFTEEELYSIFWRLREEGAENINLVTAAHFAPRLKKLISRAKEEGFDLPFVWNSSGYERVETLRSLEGLIDIYLPDLKYLDPAVAKKYSGASDYPETAKAAIAEMVRQCPVCTFDERGMMRSGVMVRHLLLPLQVKGGKEILDYLYSTYGEGIYYSLMSQYTPMESLPEAFPELRRRVTRREYENFLSEALALGIENAYIQEREAAKESFIPEFYGEEEDEGS